EIIGRVTFVYAVLLIVVRVAARRELRQITPIDLLAILLVTRAIGETAMVGDHRGLIPETFAASVLIVLAVLTRRVSFFSRRAEQMLNGTCDLLIDRGHLRADVLRHNHLTDADVRHALHEHGCQHVRDVAKAWIEQDGEITILSWTKLDQAQEHRR
ncbi:MAG TPA: YetF domain-containing protein, partial [Kofleriaceae bacterium]|nr:YetF domain-containing protein [Kofleriaceae bacterium]